jgi:hypothetical protein
MAALVCLGCTTVYSVGASRCPQCGGKKHAEQGSRNDPTLQEAGPELTAEGAEAGGPDA